MKIALRHTTMRTVALIVSAMLCGPIFGQELKEMFAKKELDLDSSLVLHCDRWKARHADGALSKAKFGPFKIIEINKVKADEPSRWKKNTDIFWVNKFTAQSRTVDFTILYNEADTIFIRALFIKTDIVKEKNFAGSFFLGSKNVFEEEHTAECRELLIKLPGDSLPWHFFPAGTYPKTTIADFGRLSSATDSLNMNYARGFKGVAKLWKDFPTGIVISKENQQVAACQLQRKKYVWLTKMTDQNTLLLLGSAMAALMSIGVR